MIALTPSPFEQWAAQHGYDLRPATFIGPDRSDLWNAPIPHICVENPVMHSHAKKLIRNYVEFSQSVQPWQFGHPETKRTCFWLKNLPPLRPTNIVEGREARVHKMPPSPDRWRERSRFFSGIAKAMSDQWPDAATCTDRQMRLI